MQATEQYTTTRTKRTGRRAQPRLQVIQGGPAATMGEPSIVDRLNELTRLVLAQRHREQFLAIDGGKAATDAQEAAI
jgi:hypothetical protein